MSWHSQPKRSDDPFSFLTIWIATFLAAAPGIAAMALIEQLRPTESLLADAALVLTICAAVGAQTTGYWHWIFHKFGWGSAPTYLLVGSSGGACLGVFLARLGGTTSEGAILWFVAVASGALGALVVWLMLRPDQSAPGQEASETSNDAKSK